MNLKSCAFTLNKCLVIGKKNLVTRKEGLCIFTFRAFGLEV